MGDGSAIAVDFSAIPSFSDPEKKCKPIDVLPRLPDWSTPFRSSAKTGRKGIRVCEKRSEGRGKKQI